MSQECLEVPHSSREYRALGFANELLVMSIVLFKMSLHQGATIAKACMGVVSTKLLHYAILTYIKDL